MDYLREFYLRYRQIISYIFSGGVAATVDVGVLYLLTEFAGLWYLASTIVGFMCGLAVSFTLQKFITFRDHRMDVLATQALKSFVYLSAINFIANVALMYLFVDVFHVWYLLARILIGIMAAIASYLVYKKMIFNQY